MTTIWTRWRWLPAAALARQLDDHPARAVAMLDWLIWSGAGC